MGDRNLTEAATLTLADFLLARIAEDERDARQAGGGTWSYSDQAGRIETGSDVDWQAEREHPWRCDDDGDDCPGYRHAALVEALHVIRWSPARVLAECEAKRRIVDDCAAIIALPDDDPTCNGLAHFVLRRLALPYADHPDYREEWRG